MIRDAKNTERIRLVAADMTHAAIAGPADLRHIVALDYGSGGRRLRKRLAARRNNSIGFSCTMKTFLHFLRFAPMPLSAAPIRTRTVPRMYLLDCCGYAKLLIENRYPSSTFPLTSMAPVNERLGLRTNICVSAVPIATAVPSFTSFAIELSISS